MKKEQEGGKEYLGGREVKEKKRINSHIVNKGPRSSYHEIHRPALLLLVASSFHNCLLMLGRKQILVEDVREKKREQKLETGTQSFSCTWDRLLLDVIVVGWHMNLWSILSFVFFSQLNQTDLGPFSNKRQRWETVQVGDYLVWPSSTSIHVWKQTWQSHSPRVVQKWKLWLAGSARSKLNKTKFNKAMGLLVSLGTMSNRKK